MVWISMKSLAHSEMILQIDDVKIPIVLVYGYGF